MPYWFETEKLKLGKENDRRIKLTDEEREHIKKLHKQGIAIREIARRFFDKCSRRTIQYVIYPERLEVMYERQRMNENWKKYYNKEKHKMYMRKYRKHKYEVFGLKCKIKDY